MAAITFPQNPTLNQEFTPAGSTVTYKWNGTFWQLASATVASSASFANSAGSASFATTSSFSARSITSSFSIAGLTASFSITSSFAVRSISSSFALTASYIQPSTASDAISASYALTASNVESSSYSLTASLLDGTASNAVSASYALTASNVETSSFSFSSSLARTASYALTASNIETSSFAFTASLARTASFLAGTASRAVSASFALTASNVQTSSFAFTSSTAFTASWAINALNAGGSTVFVTDSVPQTSSVSGTLWWNSENGNLYVQTEGPTGSQWAPANATVGTSVVSDTASFAFTASYIEIAPLASTASYFSGSGAEIYDIPAAAILGLNLAAISSGSATASFSVNGANRSLQINTNTAITGTLTTTRIIADTASFIFSTTVFETSSISFVTGSTRFGALSTNTHQFTGSVEVTGSLVSKGNFTVTGSTNTIGNTTTSGSFVLSGSLDLHQSASVSGTNIFGTASWAAQAFTASFVNHLTQSVTITGSLNLHQSASVSGTNVFGTASWAAQAFTASFLNNLSQSVTITGSLTVFTGSGVEFQVTNTGVRVGNILTDNHLITGSVGVTGSFTVFSNNNTEFRVLDNGTFIGNAQTDVHRITGSAGITGSLNVVGGGITGSLLGLATSASFAVSASSAPTNIRYQEVAIPSQPSIGSTAVDLVSFTLPVIGTYRVTQVVRSEVSSTTGVPIVYLTNNSNTLVPNSELLQSYGRTGQSTATQVSYITTTTTNEVYKSRGACASAGTMAILTDTNGRSKVTWERIV